MINVILFVIGITSSSFGAICLKLGGNTIRHLTPLSWSWFSALLTNKFILIGFVLYFVPAIIWVYLLGKLPVSVVNPIIAFTYCLTPLLAAWLLSETVPPLRWVGILVTIIGVVLVARS